MGSRPETKVCFILGIDQRSGTNYLFRLLDSHPSCVGPGPIWEDFFLEHSDKLVEYADTLYKRWNPRWEVEQQLAKKETLLEYLGDAVQRFLKLQLPENPSVSSHASQEESGLPTPKILLTKTPSVRQLDHFFDLFPDAYLIVIVRDGRSVVESGVRSFNWDYDHSIWRWRNSAESILDFKEKHKSTGKKLMVVKYEDLLKELEQSLVGIFDFLDLDHTLFDFGNAESLTVTGSSDLKKKTDSIHWKEFSKDGDFKPLTRFSDWDSTKHRRFNRVAGPQMVSMGYELDTTHDDDRLSFARNSLLNMKFLLKRIRSRIVCQTVAALQKWE